VGGHKPCRKAAAAWAPFSPWAHRSCQEPAPAWALHGLQGDSLPHHGLLHRRQGNLCSGTWSTSSLSFVTDLDFDIFFPLTYFHFSLPAAVAQQFFLLPFLNVIPEVLPLSLMGSALASSGSVLETAGLGSVRHRRGFWHLLRELPP